MVNKQILLFISLHRYISKIVFMNKINVSITCLLLMISIAAAFATSRTLFLYFYFRTNKANPPIPIYVDINCGEFGGECLVPVPGVGDRQLYRYDPIDGLLKCVGHHN